MSKIFIYTDGASRGNPGNASIGVIIKDDSGNTIKEISECLGVRTNNEAEYQALIEALKAVRNLSNFSEACCFADSELMVKQLNGVYKVRNKGLSQLYMQVNQLSKGLNIKYTHIRREQNKEADALANMALDKQNK